MPVPKEEADVMVPSPVGYQAAEKKKPTGLLAELILLLPGLLWKHVKWGIRAETAACTDRQHGQRRSAGAHTEFHTRRVSLWSMR